MKTTILIIFFIGMTILSCKHISNCDHSNSSCDSCQVDSMARDTFFIDSTLTYCE